MPIHIELSSTYDLCDSGHRCRDTPLQMIAGATGQKAVKKPEYPPTDVMHSRLNKTKDRRLLSHAIVQLGKLVTTNSTHRRLLRPISLGPC